MWRSRGITITCLFYFIKAIMASLSLSDPTIVTLPKGQIKGHVLRTGNNNTYYAFQEIPYAAPPIGSLRFAEPVEPDSWDGVLNTTRNTKMCFQQGLTSMFLTANVTQTEDCLYINVYTPGNNSDELLPVLVFIHGGAFIFWDGTYQRYGPQFLIDQKVVVVTFNYRLGPFGFLYTNDGLIPANLGLKDQNLALRWTKENVALFGGDPTKITISGQSVGATSVAYHIVSDKSSGLFRGAIMQTGSCICDYAYQPNGSYFAYELGKALDSSLTTSNTSQELLELLRSSSAEDINNVTITDIPIDYINDYVVGSRGLIWAPTIESSEYPNAFITNSTYEALESGNFHQVPLLVGFNSEESLFVFPIMGPVSGSVIDNRLVLAVGKNLNLNETSAEAAGKAIRSIYTNSTFEEDFPALIRFISEKFFVSCTVKHAEIQSNYADVYLYQFSYKGSMSQLGQLLPTVAGENVETVAHTEELSYLWISDYNEDVSQFPDSDVLTLKRLTKMWTNFVKYLNPTPEKDDLLDNFEWPKFKSDNMRFVNITETLDIRENPKNYARWREIINEYGVRPFITY